MIDELPYGEENVKKVEEIIRASGINAEIVRHPHKMITSLETHLELYGGTPEQVLKCLCFVSKDRPLILMASLEIKIYI